MLLFYYQTKQIGEKMNKFRVEFQSTKINQNGTPEIIENRSIWAKTSTQAVKSFQNGIAGIKPLNGGNWELKSVTNS